MVRNEYGRIEVAFTELTNEELKRKVIANVEQRIQTMQSKLKEVNRLSEMLDECGFVRGTDYLFSTHSWGHRNRFSSMPKIWEVSHKAIVDHEKEMYAVEVHNYPSFEDNEYEYTLNILLKKLVISQDALGMPCAQEEWVKVEFGDKSGYWGGRDYTKVVCRGITENDRKILPSTLLKKFKENRDYVSARIEVLREKENVIQYTINKYKSVYPDAEVKEVPLFGYKSRHIGKGVRIKFANESDIELIVSAKDQETMHRYHDKKVSKLELTDLIDYLSK